jgi:hypothetical protein
MATKRNHSGAPSGRAIGSPSSKPVEGRRRDLPKLDDNRSRRFGSPATDGAFERRRAVRAKKLEVGITYVLNETTEDALAKRGERHAWSRNGLLPRNKLKLKLTRKQHKMLQTPSYMR